MTLSPADPSSSPKVWVLTDDKLGHTTQSSGLADALGWPRQTKALHFNRLNRLSNRLLGAGLLSLDRRRSAPLQAPWPDLVISTGRRTVPVARWIAARSGGRTRLVQLGRKGADRADHFDLSVACAHFGLPPHSRRIVTLAPLTAIDARKLRDAAERWRHLFGESPHPHVALLVGGTSAVHRFDPDTARRMVRDVLAFTQGGGGSLYVVTSPRTGSACTAALREGLGEAGHLYEWTRDDPANPYLGALAVADVLVVTGDSESMVAEAAATARPLYIYALPSQRGAAHWRMHLRRRVLAGAEQTTPSLGRSVCGGLLGSGLVRTPRDLEAMHRCLIEAGRARPFGAPMDAAAVAPLRELDLVADRVRALFDAVGKPTAAGID